MNLPIVRAAIVGCGKIADSHAGQIGRIANARIVAAFDTERLMADQFCDRFGVEGSYSNFDELLAKARPAVVHITTPPQNHLTLARTCLENGCHVYVEKPLTCWLHETEELVALAEQSGRLLTVGHDAQFTHVANDLRALVESGYLGGAPVHLEATYGYDLGDAVYAKALLGNKGHWVRQLPGKLLHNVISHGIAKIAEYITSDEPQVIAHGFISPFLRSIGETEVVDELRVVINDANQRTAYFTFSSQMRPIINQFRVYGPKHGLFLDETQQTLIRLSGDKYKSYGERLLPQYRFARQYKQNARRNLRRFLGCDFHFETGKKHLIERFYAAIRQNGTPPIPYREIVLATKIMERIFAQLAEHLHPAAVPDAVSLRHS